MRTPRTLAIVPVVLALALAGCTAGAPDATDPTGSAAAPSSVAATVTSEAHQGELDFDESDVTDLDLATAATDGLVTITEAGTYRVHGELDGTVLVRSPGEGTVRLVLDGATITGTSGPAINIDEADDAVIVLAAGTTSTLADAAGEAADTEANAALYSREDLTIGGEGALVVDGRSNDGIGSVDGLVIEGGTITVDAVDDGVRGKDYLVVRGGTLTVTAAGDGLKADNEDAGELGWFALEGGDVTITSGDDGVHTEGLLAISGGTLDVLGSVEGIEGSIIEISGGTTTIVASDDGVNVSDGSGGGAPGAPTSSDLYLAISGGELEVDAEGDGIDVNGTATMSGGTVVVHGPTGAGNGALDADGGWQQTGGVLVAAGSLGMVVAPDADSPQGWVAFTVEGGSAGSTLEVSDGGGEVLGTYTARKAFSSLVFSAPGVTSGTEYALTGAGVDVTATAGELVGGGFGGGPGGPGAPGDRGGRGERPGPRQP